jgi:hypothetical protein
MEQKIVDALGEAGLPAPPPAALRAAIQGNARADRVMYTCVQALAYHVERSYALACHRESSQENLQDASISQALVLTGVPLLSRFLPQSSETLLKGRELLLAFCWLAETLLEQHENKKKSLKAEESSELSSDTHTAPLRSRQLMMKCEFSARTPHTKGAISSEQTTNRELDVAGHVRAALTVYRQLHLDLREHARLQRELCLTVKQRLRNRLSVQSQRMPMSILEILREPVVWKAVRHATCRGGCLPISSLGRRERRPQPRSVWWAWMLGALNIASPEIPPSISTGVLQHSTHTPHAAHQQSPARDMRTRACASRGMLPLSQDTGLPVHPAHTLSAAADADFFFSSQQAAQLSAKLEALKECLSAWEMLLPALQQRAALTGRAGRGAGYGTGSQPMDSAFSKRLDAAKAGSVNEHDAIECAKADEAFTFVAGVGFARDDLRHNNNTQANQNLQGPPQGWGLRHDEEASSSQATVGQVEADVRALREEQRGIVDAAREFVGAACSVSFRGR